MKKLFTAVVLVLLFALPFPLGSSQKSLHNETKIWTYKSYESVMEDRQKQLTCLAKNIYFEARNEPFAGQFAVALVTLNRVNDSAFPNTICDVVYEGSHFANGHPKRDMCQFSWYCDGKGDVPGPGPLWEESQRVAREMVRRHITAQLLDITDGATHYHASWMERYPRWSNERKKMTHIDQHIFYR